MSSNKEIFNYVKGNNSESIDWSKPDFTGKNADYYLHKYTNRPEDAGNLEDFQKPLGNMGVIAPPADALNAAIYALQGEWGDAAISTAAILPVIGEMKAVSKLAKKSGEKMVTLYRGVDKWHPGKMVEKGNFVGGGRYLGEAEGIKKKGLWVTTSKEYATGEAFGNKQDILLKFEVPESFFKSKFTRTGIHEGRELGFFSEGIPKTFLTKVHGKVKREPLTPLQEKLLKLKNSPNVGANITQAFKEMKLKK